MVTVLSVQKICDPRAEPGIRTGAINAPTLGIKNITFTVFSGAVVAAAAAAGCMYAANGWDFERVVGDCSAGATVGAATSTVGDGVVVFISSSVVDDAPFCC